MDFSEDGGPAAAKPHVYYPALDGYRAVAVLMVFTVHYLGQQIPGFRNWGWMGVDFFFVLSGFLITGILYDSRHRLHRFRDFYARRVLRIFPLYYGVWLSLLALTYVFHWRWNWEWLLWPLHLGNFARFIFYQPGSVAHLDVLYAQHHKYTLLAAYMGHFWSLCVEEQFYLVWPAVVLLVRSRRVLVIVCSAIVLTEPLLRWLLLKTLPAWMLQGEFLARCTLTRLDSLVLGGLIALLLRGSAAAWLHRYGRMLSLGAVLLFAGFLFDYRVRRHSLSADLTDGVLSTVGLSLVALLAAGLLLELVREHSPLGRAAAWGPLRRLGQVSYGFYIFHDLPHALYADVARSLPVTAITPWITAAVAFCGTLALSLLSYRYFETPFLRLKARFADQVHRSPAA